jgi:hypothetical protein
VLVRFDHVPLTNSTHFRIFSRNLAPDFTHYLSERARNEFSRREFTEGQDDERKLNKIENKNHQQNPFSETSVSSIAAVYSLDAVWYQMLTGASCERLRNLA